MVKEKREAAVGHDADLGPRCACGHPRAVHMVEKGDCLADVEDPEAAGVSTCFCERFVQKRAKGEQG